MNKPSAYWPQIGIAIGACLNVIGVSLNKPLLIAAGSNALTVAGLFLVQRRKNGKDE